MDGLNTREMDQLRNNDLANYMEGFDILQRFGGV